MYVPHIFASIKVLGISGLDIGYQESNPMGQALRQHLKISALAIGFTFLFILLCSSAFANSFFEQFIDPEDGKFDTSNWILNKKGFLPVPIIITEPAVGYGGGVALLFFHAKKDEPVEDAKRNLQNGAEERKPSLPPSISGVMGLATENGTWAAGGFHFGTWRKDHIRYTGAVGYPSVNLTFYGSEERPILKNGIDYNLEGWFLLQEIIFRIKNTNLFLGPKLTYFDSTSTIDTKFSIKGINSWELGLKNYGLGLVLKYDSRDNIFTPNTGINAEISTLFYKGEGIISSREYTITDATSRIYWKLPVDVILGWRLDGGFSGGDVPFYSLPYINLRGIPAMRYQGQYALSTDVEARWNVNDRWSLVFFGGLGRTADSMSNFSDSEDRWAGGAGFRYLIARVLGLYTGVDIARGPEEWTFYIQTGSAW